MVALAEAHGVVREYSATWYEPVISMPARLNEAVSCAYLLMRGIDEIEDHPDLAEADKAVLLRGVGRTLQLRFSCDDLAALFAGHEAMLPEVTLPLGEWAGLAPPDIGPRVWETFATMAERMAHWAESGFAVHDEQDLDRYTYAVAGTLVLLLSDLWTWYDGTRSSRTLGVAYGRALQSVNILVDRGVDAGRGVDFWPDGWQAHDMVRYARQELALADAYLAGLPDGPARTFCAEPLVRAHRALALQPWTPTPRKATTMEGQKR
ncbi:squalene/phytoene synthase family protein [Streptomyces alboflavus]|uniref:squalene/phytoene synthase family protein n=1 Tax=Streptomyces alboflavus TaxID=67267 RepID=UPI000F65849D|nr:squalene/phytoene synthase family protein [Streptomyces alboflavus]